MCILQALENAQNPEVENQNLGRDLVVVIKRRFHLYTSRQIFPKIHNFHLLGKGYFHISLFLHEFSICVNMEKKMKNNTLVL